MQARVYRAVFGITALGMVLAACSATESERSASRSFDLAVSSDVVIRQVFGGGGNAGGPYTHDFIELFNRGSVPVNLAGWSVQYASASGTGNFGSTTTQLTELPAVMLAPGQSYLIQEAVGSTLGAAALPTPDLVDASPIAMSATGGKVALVNTASSLGCNGSSTPCSAAQTAQVIDLVGYGAANFSEGGSPTPATSNSTSVQRLGGGCVDTNNNAADFSVGAVEPRNSSSPLSACSNPGGGSGGSGSGGNGGGAGQAGQGGAAGSETGGTSSGGTSSGGAPSSGPLRIRDVQGASHLSPRNGQSVTNLPGIVTALTNNGFYLQDPSHDSDDATSEGILVFTGSAPGVNVGDSVLVTGPITEFRPGCTPSCSTTSSAYHNLTITEVNRPTTITVLTNGNALPAPVRLGQGGRIVPASVIDDDGAGSVETSSAVFDPASDGIDFYESLEGMRVEIANAQVAGPTRTFGSGASQNKEIALLADGGASAATLTGRGGIVIASADFNPERVFLSDALPNSIVLPDANVADRFLGTVEGILDYSFGNFKLLATTLPSLTSGGLTQETVSFGAPLAQQLTVASFNVENLDTLDPAEKFQRLAGLIVHNLGAPDLLTLEEVQDNNGPINDGTVEATQTFAALIGAIQAAGGPTYDYRSIDPENNKDGGEPGGNIRVAFLFRTDRGLSFVDRPGASATTATTAFNNAGMPELTFSPGRIDPLNTAFSSSRKPLVGEFQFNGKKLFLVANHFNSKGGDQGLFGRFQPPTLSSEAQRIGQATVVATFVQSLMAIDPQAAVLVAGDINDFEFSAPMSVLKSVGLSPLVENLPAGERYTYVFEGNSQALDHILVSPSLAGAPLSGFDIVHVNAEFLDQASDHDPLVARFTLGSAPTAKVSAVLECVTEQAGIYTAHFGYKNPNLLPVTIPIGSQNKFTPAPIDRGQSTLFMPGRQVDTFAVDFTSGNLVWSLNGRTATASTRSKRCR